MDECASGPGLYIHNLSALGSRYSASFLLQKSQDEQWDNILFAPTDLSAVATNLSAVLSSGKSAGFRARLRTKSSPPADSSFTSEFEQS